MKTVTSSPALPPELIHHILRFTYYLDHTLDRVDTQTLSACSLVCCAWNEEAQRLLFHAVYLPKTVLPEGTSPERAHRIGTYVRRLDIHLLKNDRFSIMDFVEILRKCPNLYELVLWFQPHELDKQAMKALAHPSHPTRIVALNLQYCGIQSPILFQLLSLWPSIRFLRLGTEVSASPPPELPSFRLYELMLVRNPPAATVLWLLSSSEGHLRILDFRDPPGLDIEPVLDMHGPHLQSLRFFRQPGQASVIVQKCPNLKELILLQISNYFKLDGLPSTLEHFSFRNFAWGGIGSLAPVIRVIDQLPNLKLVTCDERTRMHPDFSKLVKRCKERGVELSTEAPSTLMVSGLKFSECGWAFLIRGFGEVA